MCSGKFPGTGLVGSHTWCDLKLKLDFGTALGAAAIARSMPSELDPRGWRTGSALEEMVVVPHHELVQG